MHTLISDESTFRLFQGYLQADLPPAERLALVRQIVDTLEGWRADGQGMEGTLAAAELNPFRIQLARAIEARGTLLQGQWWAWFGKEKAVVSRVAKANGLGTQREDLQKLGARLHNRLELEQWLENSLLSVNPADLDSIKAFDERHLAYFQRAERAADAGLRISKKPWYPVLAACALRAASVQAFTQILHEVLDWLKAWERKEAEMMSFLLEMQWGYLLTEPKTLSQQLRQELGTDFDSLVEMDTIAAAFSPAEASVTKLVLDQCSECEPKGNAVSIFDNSLRLAWIEHIENKFPILRAVSSLKMQEWEQQLQGGILHKQNLSRDITLMKLREFTYENLENNRLGNRTTYRELYHQVTKKRNIWPIRRVLDEYAEEVFQLVPVLDGLAGCSFHALSHAGRPV